MLSFYYNLPPARASQHTNTSIHLIHSPPYAFCPNYNFSGYQFRFNIVGEYLC